MKNVRLIDLTEERLVELFDERLAIKIDKLKRELLTQDANEELLSRDEAASLLKVDLTTIWSWSKKGKIQAYGIAGRRYFKRSEIMAAIKQLEK